MPNGKAAAQAGHAFLDSFLNAPTRLAQTYADHGGTKIVLVAPDEAALRAIYAQAIALEIPAALVTDEHHILPPHFDGRPILTAVGLGPATRAQVEPLTGSLRTM